jgi:aminoglycoside/choline kinase family phosphotransferase
VPTSESPLPAEIPGAIRSAADQWGGGETRITPLTGDASPRTYYRAQRTTTDPEAAATIILADYHGPIDPQGFSFLETTALFVAAGVPVPVVVQAELPAGLLLLEDLGDDLLQSVVTTHGSAGALEVRQIYDEAVDLIGRLQDQGTAHIDPATQAGRLRLDGDLFRHELNFFFQHLVIDHVGKEPSPSQWQQVGEAFDNLCNRLDAEPQVLCHRDYHSRNLLLGSDGKLTVIDHQDARRGPDTYDLASLLDDPYVERGEAWREKMIDRFLSARASGEDPARFRNRLDAMSIQRLLKAAGTYAAQEVRHGHSFYLDYLPPALARARTCMLGHPDHADLLAALIPLVPELAPA